MIVRYYHTTDWKNEPSVEQAWGQHTWCCDDMQAAWKDERIKFDNDDVTDPGVCLRFHTWVIEHYDDRPIGFCPFCGKMIVLTEVSKPTDG